MAVTSNAVTIPSFPRKNHDAQMSQSTSRSQEDLQNAYINTYFTERQYILSKLNRGGQAKRTRAQLQHATAKLRALQEHASNAVILAGYASAGETEERYLRSLGNITEDLREILDVLKGRTPSAQAVQKPEEHRRAARQATVEDRDEDRTVVEQHAEATVEDWTVATQPVATQATVEDCNEDRTLVTQHTATQATVEDGNEASTVVTPWSSNSKLESAQSEIQKNEVTAPQVTLQGATPLYAPPVMQQPDHDVAMEEAIPQQPTGPPIHNFQPAFQTAQVFNAPPPPAWCSDEMEVEETSTTYQQEQLMQMSAPDEAMEVDNEMTYQWSQPQPMWPQPQAAQSFPNPFLPQSTPAQPASMTSSSAWNHATVSSDMEVDDSPGTNHQALVLVRRTVPNTAVPTAPRQTANDQYALVPFGKRSRESPKSRGRGVSRGGATKAPQRGGSSYTASRGGGVSSIRFTRAAPQGMGTGRGASRGVSHGISRGSRGTSRGVSFRGRGTRGKAR